MIFKQHRVHSGKNGPNVGYRYKNYGVCNATFTDYPEDK